MGESDQVTRLLGRAAGGDRDAVDKLVAAVYDDLRAIAERHLRRERSDHTLQPTALVHEAYCRLLDQHQTSWRDRAHFFAIASRVIRRILVDHARGRNALKRGGAERPLRIDGIDVPEAHDVDLVALDEAIEQLEAVSPVQARVVQLRYFGGLTIDEMADVLEMGKRSVDREWSCAKAFLYRQLSDHG